MTRFTTVIYFFTGFDEKRKFLGYNHLTNEWRELPDVGFNLAFGTIGTFAFDGKGYAGLLTSKNGGGFTRRTRRYDPIAGSWTMLSEYPGVEASYVRTVCTNKGVYFIGGTFKDKPINTVWFYKPDEDIWEQKADFPGEPGGVFGFSINDKVYAGCAAKGKDFWEYDPASDKWERVNDYPGMPAKFSFAIQDKGYVGHNTINVTTPNETWCYTDTE